MREMEAINEQQVRRFLLGDRSEEERAETEERFFKEDPFYRQILAVQEELADDYVRNNLSLTERAQFKKYFLQSSLRRERVKFATAFDKALERNRSQREIPIVTQTPWQSLISFFNPINSRLAAGAVAASLLLVAGTIWLVIEYRRLSHEVQVASLDQKSLLERALNREVEGEQREEALEKEIAALRAAGKQMETEIQQKQNELEELKRIRRSERPSDSRPSALAAFILTPGLTRGVDEPEKLIIPPATRTIHLQLDRETDDDYKSYVVEVRTTRGNMIWGRSGLKMQRTGYGFAVFVSIPRELLSPGEYELVLKGAAPNRLEAVGYYYFIALNR